MDTHHTPKTIERQRQVGNWTVSIETTNGCRRVFSRHTSGGGSGYLAGSFGGSYPKREARRIYRRLLRWAIRDTLAGR
jgi:hypothetical protein